MSEIDFLPERIRQRRQRTARLKRQGVLLLLCVAAMAGLTVIRQHRIAQASADVVMLNACYRNIQDDLNRIGPLERMMGDLMIKKRINGELGSRTDCTAVLAELCRVMPSNVSLRSLEMQTADFKPDTRSAKPGENAPVRSEEGVKRVRIVFEGLAPTDVDIANFIGQLSSSCLFEDVNMSYSKSIPFRGRVAREFEASCYLAK